MVTRISASRLLSLSPLAGLMALVVVLSLGCISIGDATAVIPRNQEPAPEVDRLNCEEIAGTAFRSDAERSWYGDNCSRWPLVNVPEQRGGNVAQQRQEPAECAGIRGRPYTSDQQRSWYLQNCNQTTTTGSTGQSQPGSGDRTNCNEIRGTSYRSIAERDWYVRNCPATGPAPSGAPVTSGPDRTSCDEIRGTAYRSNSERDWFVRNCSGTTAANGGQQNQQIVVIRPSQANSNDGEEDDDDDNRSNRGRGRD